MYVFFVRDRVMWLQPFLKALFSLRLPVRDILSVLGAMYENTFRDAWTEQIDGQVQAFFCSAEGMDALADCALHGSASERCMAVKGLGGMAERADGLVRKTLLRCFGDASGRVQRVLAEVCIAHPAWERDVFPMLKDRSAAKRALAARVLAGMGANGAPDEGKTEEALVNFQI